MKSSNGGLLLIIGALFGLCVALTVGAVESKDAPPKDWSRLKVIAYPNGGTGFFDPDTATIYVYDSDLSRCYLIRKIGTLGQPMFRP
ncbi:MAG: hypothetical protein ABIQ35_12090 [Verrucomicrobiota bacterium]